jgi:hypothetical protein
MSQADKALTTTTDDATTSRRSVLRAGSALAAGLCLPWGSAVNAATSQDKTAIGKLWLEYQALLPEIERLSREEQAASERFYASVPPVPEEMRISAFHAHMCGLKPWHIVGRHQDLTVAFIDTAGWRHAVERPLLPAETGPLAGAAFVTQHRARAREVLPIAERYHAAVVRIDVASGRKAANDALDAVFDRKGILVSAIFGATAETLADLLIQVKLCEAEGCTEDGDPHSEGGNFPDWVGRALIRSIRNLAGEGLANA